MFMLEVSSCAHRATLVTRYRKIDRKLTDASSGGGDVVVGVAAGGTGGGGGVGGGGGGGGSGRRRCRDGGGRWMSSARESLSVIVPPQDVDVDSRDADDSELLSPGKLTPTSGISVSVASMIDATDFRAMQPEPTYQTLTSVAERMSPPGFSPGSSYATLTPLQPLPPISTMSDKFVYGGHAASGVTGSFAVMQNNGLGNIGLSMGGSPYAYDKLPTMSMSPPHNYPSPGAGLQPSPLSPQSAYSQSGLNSPHKSSASPHYDPAFLPRLQQSPAALSPSSPPAVSATASFAPSHHSPPGTHSQQQQQQQQQSMPQQQTISHTQHVQHTSVVMKTVSAAGNGGAGEVEEINTKELAQRISAELKRYSIPQAIFAQRVLCRSQGTLSDLLRNPKPWSKLKSGRETFRRMWKWLQEPEFQRMSALRLAALSNCSESGGEPDAMLDMHHPGTGIDSHHPQFHNSYEPPFPRKNETLVDGEFFSSRDNLEPFDVSGIISEVSSYPGLTVNRGNPKLGNYVTALHSDGSKIQGCDVITILGDPRSQFTGGGTTSSFQDVTTNPRVKRPLDDKY
ncbi:ONEC2 protein, partial [Pseudoatta argentina]